MKNCLPGPLNTLIKYVGQTGQTFFSLTLWLTGFLFLTAGFAVFIHQELSNWNVVPHFSVSTMLLFLATKRYAQNWTGPNKKWFFVSMGGLVLVVALALLATATYQKQDSLDSGGEFSDIVSDYAFGATRWTVRANIEDFAEFMTWWSGEEQLNPESEHRLVLAFFDAAEIESSLTRKYDKDGLTAEERKELSSARELRREMQRSVELILSRNVSVLFKKLGLNAPWYHNIIRITQQTDFRFAPRINRLIIAERDKLERYAYATLDPELTGKERDSIEASIEERGYSALVVGVAGIGTSPSMVIPQGLRSTLRTIAHERIHVLLYTTELGRENASESRVIEETVASLLGDSIGDMVYCRYYDKTACEKVPENDTVPETAANPDKFDDRAVLRETYITVEAMLKEGRIEEAEAYMTVQRDYLEENGRFIRKLNQAYFAFSGAYADSPEYADANGGIGRKLQELWSRCQTPGEFFETVREISSLDELERVLSGKIDGTCNS